MAKLIDKMAAYFDRKGDTYGEWFTRVMIGFFWLFAFAGFAWGMLLGSMAARAI